MGKGKKRRRCLIESECNTASEITSNQEFTTDEINTTVAVIKRLSENVTLLASKEWKDLRRVLHPLVLQQMQTYEPIDYGARVTSALTNEKWADALVAIRGCHDFQQIPKQGTMQRWVRECDKAGDYKLKLLCNLLRLSNGKNGNNIHDAGTVLSDELKSDDFNRDELHVLDSWSIPEQDHLPAMDVLSSVCDVTEVKFESKIIYKELAANRKPPNNYDLILHSNPPHVIKWTETVRPELVKYSVPFVPGAFCVTNVLCPQECYQLRSAATNLGFCPDHPTSMDVSTGIDSCEWFVDSSILDILFHRIKRFLPVEMEGAVLHSLNPRWRFFRYNQNCVYRPHIDGSWPQSLINPKGEYEIDESGKVKSYLTFLIYLSQDFTGGETRFYFPGENGMEARGIIPKEGAVLVFPQGNISSLIHEGAAVTDGIKYVIRTDVLYTRNR